MFGHILALRWWLLSLLVALSFSWVANVFAHGKQVIITVTPLTPDPARPLIRLYLAEVKFEDGDAVENAQLELTARRKEGGQTTGPVVFYPLGEPGLYATEIQYERYGNWTVTVSVAGPGEGETSFTDRILPSEAASAGTPQGLSVLFKFNGLDALNIVFRFVHSLAGVAWFGLLGVVLVSDRFVSPSARAEVMNRLSRIFIPTATASLGILGLSGIYNAIWDAPIKPPGVLNLPVMGTIPFGPVYLAALAGKILAFVVLVYIAIQMGGGLHRFQTDSTLATNGELFRLAWAGAGTGIFLAIDVSILIYMHYISHLAVVTPR